MFGPFALAAALIPVRSSLQHTNAALVLVLAVVAVAATRQRGAGAAAALSAGLGFDFFLTSPYESFDIHGAGDAETAALLLLVGIGVSELAWWGRRQQAAATRASGYLSGLHDAAQIAVAANVSPSEVIARVCHQLETMLGLTSCRFDYGTGLGHPRLRHDALVALPGPPRRGGTGHLVDVTRDGLPTEPEVELYVESGGSFRGRFLLQAPPGCRPTQEQLVVAVAIADQVGATLAGYVARHPAA